MIEKEVLGTIIWECSEEEIRRMWKDTPESERYRFWTDSEVTAHMRDTPEQLQKALDRKKVKPGRI